MGQPNQASCLSYIVMIGLRVLEGFSRSEIVKGALSYFHTFSGFVTDLSSIFYKLPY